MQRNSGRSKNRTGRRVLAALLALALLAGTFAEYPAAGVIVRAEELTEELTEEPKTDGIKMTLTIKTGEGEEETTKDVEVEGASMEEAIVKAMETELGGELPDKSEGNNEEEWRQEIVARLKKITGIRITDGKISSEDWQWMYTYSNGFSRTLETFISEDNVTVETPLNYQFAYVSIKHIEIRTLKKASAMMFLQSNVETLKLPALEEAGAGSFQVLLHLKTLELGKNFGWNSEQWGVEEVQGYEVDRGRMMFAMSQFPTEISFPGLTCTKREMFYSANNPILTPGSVLSDLEKCDQDFKCTLSSATNLAEDVFTFSSIKEVECPAVLGIEKNAFCNAWWLRTLVLPSVEVIDGNAFGYDADLWNELKEAIEQEDITLEISSPFEHFTELYLPQEPPKVGVRYKMKGDGYGNLSEDRDENDQLVEADDPNNLRAFQDLPKNRTLHIVDKNGTPVRGKTLKEAVCAYQEDEGWNSRTQTWYGWKLDETYDVSVQTKLDGENWAGKNDLKPILKKGSKTYEMQDNETEGLYKAEKIPSGKYNVCIQDGEKITYTGEKINVSDKEAYKDKAELNFYTVAFREKDGTQIADAQVVLKGQTVEQPVLSGAGREPEAWCIKSGEDGSFASFYLDEPITGNMTVYADRKPEKTYGVSVQIRQDGTVIRKDDLALKLVSDSTPGTACDLVYHQGTGAYQAAGLAAGTYRVCKAENSSGDTAPVVTTVTTGQGATDTAYAYIDYYTVTFKDGETDYVSEVVLRGEKAAQPEAVAKEGWTFQGWKKRGEDDAFDFDTPITGSVTVYADWVQEQTNPEPPVKEPEQSRGVSVEIRQDGEKTRKDGLALELVRDGAPEKTYALMYREESGAYIAETVEPGTYSVYETVARQSKDTGVDVTAGAGATDTAYACLDYYTVTFKNGGTRIGSQMILKGQKAARPENPTAEGREFDAWYAKRGEDEAFDFDVPIDRTIDLYAGWKAVKEPESPADTGTVQDPDPVPENPPADAAPVPTPENPPANYIPVPAPEGGSAGVQVTERTTLKTLKETELLIIRSNTDKSDPKGSTFRKLRLRAYGGKKSVTLRWVKAKGAKGYIIYGAACGKPMKKIASVGAKKTKYTHKKLKAGKYYKYCIVAYKNVNGTKHTIATAKSAHAVTKGKKYVNPKSVSCSKLTVKVKKTKKLKPKYRLEKKKGKTQIHIAKFRYESSNSKIASVSKNGKVKGKKKGSCYIYVFAQNGMYKKIKVTVKK